MLGSLGPEHPYYPYPGWVAVHEISHRIQNLCFRVEDHEEWDGFYAEAVQAGVYPGTHMMANVREFFAGVHHRILRGDRRAGSGERP